LKLGEDVGGVGYVQMYARSIQTQLPLDRDETETILKYNDSKQSADTRLPVVNRAKVHSSGSAGNTMFLFQRCVLQKSLAPESFVADADGRLSLDRLRVVASSFADAVEAGVQLSSYLVRSGRNLVVCLTFRPPKTQEAGSSAWSTWLRSYAGFAQ
jgi:hypothetical protein